MLSKSYPFTAFFFFIFFASHAQQQVGKHIEDHLLIKVADKDRYGDPEKETIGSPYLNDAFVNGTVYAFNQTYTDVPIRYDIYSDYFEFQQKNQTFILDPEPRIKQVDFDDKTFVVLKYVYRGKASFGFLQVIDSGKVMLLAKKTILYREWQPAKALESAPTPAKFTKTDDVYYYKIGNGEVLRVESLKKFIGTFPDKQTELADYAKKEKLGTKNAEDLKKLLTYYNSL